MKRTKLALTVSALGLGLFMTMLDSTIVNISIPAMMDDFGVDIGRISWVLDGYLIALAALALTMGRLADQFGRRLLYVIGLVVFTVGSLLCALAWNVDWLIGFRVLQAVGGAVMIPVTMAVMTAVFPAHRRGAAMGVWAAIGITAAAIGPSLGGVIVEHLSWHWVFYINIPIGIVAVGLALVGVAESRDPSTPKTLDLTGMGLFTVGICALVLAVIEGEGWGWGSPSIVSLFVVAVLALVVFAWWEAGRTAAMLDLTLFRGRTFSGAVICQALVGFGMLGAMFLLTLFLQRILGYSALRAAVAITPIPATALVMAPLAGRLCDRIGSRLPAVVGTAVLAVGVYLFSHLGIDSGWGAVAWRSVVMGAGMGLSNAGLAVAAMGSVPSGKEGVGSGVLNTGRLVGMTLGVAVCTALLTGAVADRLPETRSAAETVIAADEDIPGPAKALILAELEKMGEQGASQSMPDIVGLAKERGIPAAMLPVVERLSERISAVVREGLTGAFAHVFPWAAGIVAVGIIPAAFLRDPRGRRGVEPVGRGGARV